MEADEALPPGAMEAAEKVNNNPLVLPSPFTNVPHLR